MILRASPPHSSRGSCILDKMFAFSGICFGSLQQSENQRYGSGVMVYMHKRVNSSAKACHTPHTEYYAVPGHVLTLELYQYDTTLQSNKLFSLFSIAFPNITNQVGYSILTELVQAKQFRLTPQKISSDIGISYLSGGTMLLRSERLTA